MPFSLSFFTIKGYLVLCVLLVVVMKFLRVEVFAQVFPQQSKAATITLRSIATIINATVDQLPVQQITYTQLAKVRTTTTTTTTAKQSTLLEKVRRGALFKGGVKKKSTLTLPVRRITHTPGYHSFGYFDKSPWSHDLSLLLMGRTQFYNHDINVQDMLDVLVLQLSNNKIMKVAQTHAFNFQQGAMLNWIGQSHNIIFNDRSSGDALVARILDVESGAERELPRPIYALSHDGRFATSIDFYRLQLLCTGFGYPASEEKLQKSISQKAADDDGLWVMDVASGSAHLVVSYADMARHFKTPSACWLWFNHAQFMFDGDRIVFAVHMKCQQTDNFKNLGLFTVARIDRMRSLQRVHSASGANTIPSHHDGMGHGNMLLSCAGNGYTLWDDAKQDGTLFWQTTDGHCSFNPVINSIIMSDTYPQPCTTSAKSTCPRGKKGKHLFLLDVISGNQFLIGQFESHEDGAEHVRSDLHPRWSPDGRMIAIDSIHKHDGRQLFILNVSAWISQRLRTATGIGRHSLL